MLIAIDGLVLGLLVYQLMVVYRHNYKLNFHDKRIQILCLCIASSFYLFLHYGVIPRSSRADTFVMIEFFRLCILYSICLYYCAKSSGLLENRKRIIIFLTLFFCVGALVMIIFGIWVGILPSMDHISAKNLCTQWQYQTW